MMESGAITSKPEWKTEIIVPEGNNFSKLISKVPPGRVYRMFGKKILFRCFDWGYFSADSHLLVTCSEDSRVVLYEFSPSKSRTQTKLSPFLEVDISANISKCVS
jgi:hypothetical protein